MPQLLRGHVEAATKIATPSYNRLSRSHEFYVQMAADLGDWWWRLEDDSGDKDAGLRRLERSHMEEAAIDLADLVRRLPGSCRRIVEARAAGHSWRTIFADNPDRVGYSMMDDWEGTLRAIWAAHEDLVRRVA